MEGIGSIERTLDLYSEHLLCRDSRIATTKDVSNTKKLGHKSVKHYPILADTEQYWAISGDIRL